MARPSAERHHLARIVFASQLVLFVGAVIAYRFLGHRTVQDAHAQQSLGFLNRAFEGRDSAPVGLYLALADKWVADLTALALLCLIAQALLFAVWNAMSGRRRSSKEAASVQSDDASVSTDDASFQPHDGSVRSDDASVQEASNLSLTKRIVFTSIVLLIPVMFVTVPYAWRYASYMGRLEKPAGLDDGTYQPPKMPGLTPEQLLQLGKAHKEDAPIRSYLRHPARKPEGVVRIGVFGGSFALGEEAAPEHDVSTHLERILEEAGVGDVEVINFGVSGYGMSQAALLWEYVGRCYELDHVILMPLFFHIRRDNSFLHTDHHYGPLHGLYVTEGDSVRFVPVVGEDRLDSCRRYFSPLQPFRYWRYDVRVPMLVRPLMPSPLGRRGNPFYYQDDEELGTVEMYKALFQKIASECRQLVVFTDPTLRPQLEGIQSDRIHLMETRLDDFRDASSSLYRAPLDHPSGLGYQLYATEMAHLLLGRDRPTYDILTLGDQIELDTFPAAAEVELGGLSAMEDVVLEIAGSRVGEFRRRPADDGGRSGPVGETVDFGEERIQSIAAYLRAGTRVFVPLPFLLKADEPIDLVWQSAGDSARVRVGKVTTGAGIVGQLDIDWTRLDGRSSAERLRPTDAAGEVADSSTPSWYGRVDEDDEFGVIEITSDQDLGGFRLEIGGKVALEDEVNEVGHGLLPLSLRRLLFGRPWVRNEVRLSPVVSGLLYFRGTQGDFVDIAGLEQKDGWVDLRFTDPGGEVHELPLLSYRVERVLGPRYEPRYGAPLATR